MAAPTSGDAVPTTDSPALFGPGVPPFPAGASHEEMDAHWHKYVYQGDKMRQLTWRAVWTGGLLGMALAASNLYTTLHIGWAFGVAITASVISFVLWRVAGFIADLIPWMVLHICGMVALVVVEGTVIVLNLTGSLSPMFTVVFGGVAGIFVVLGYLMLLSSKNSKMSILETNCMSSAASAAGYSTGSTIATMFGALVLRAALPAGQTSETLNTWAIHPAWLVASFTLLTGLMGVFLAIPMKRQMINHEQLPFPSGIAAAETLRSLYSASKEAARKAYVLLVGLGIGAVVALLRAGEGTFAFLDKFYKATHLVIPEQLPAEGFTKINNKQIYGYSVDTSVLLVAAGMIVGMRVSLSMLLGSAILYFWLGPMLVSMDMSHAGDASYIPSIDTIAGGTMYHYPRWGLWGGTALMVMASLTALAFQWKTIVRAFRGVGDSGASDAHMAAQADLKSIEVPFGWMVMGMVPITIGMLIIQVVAFSIAWWAGLIAVGMSFVLSLVASRATGETDTTPIGAMGKVMQLIFAVLKPGEVAPNLAAAGIAANSASSSADLLTDLKSGYLLGANPRKQFLAQFFGCFFGTLAIVPIWYLMVPTKAALEKLPAPATQTWAKVAEVLTKGFDFLPASAKTAMVVGGLLGIALPVIEKFLVPAKYRKYMPSAAGLGLSFMLPFYNSLAFTFGSLIAWAWSLIEKRSFSAYCIPLASGLVAGESLIAAFIAMLATAAGLLGWHI